MRILYIVSLYPCWSETFIVREISYLRKQGINIDILSLRGDKEEFVQKDAIEGIDSVIYTKGIMNQVFSFVRYFITNPVILSKWLIRILFAFWSKPITLLKNISTIMRTLSVIDQLENSDHIHAHWATYPSTAAFLISELTSKPFSFTSHAHDIFLENHFIPEKVNASKFSATISGYNVSLLSNMNGLDSSKLKIVHCGIDPDDYVLENADKEFNILSVGRLDEIKGFKYLIEAVAILKAKGIDLKCNIIGSGELKNDLEALRKKLDVEDNIVFHGAKEQSEVRNMMIKSDMFVLPSIKTSSGNIDGIPVVLMESMALGTPVISTKVSGIPELIFDNDNGLIVNEKDPQQLADAINKMLNVTEDEKKLMIKNARKTIEKEFNINIEAEKLLQLIKA